MGHVQDQIMHQHDRLDVMSVNTMFSRWSVEQLASQGPNTMFYLKQVSASE